MRDLAQTPEVVDPGLVRRSARRLGEAGITLPTFAQLADPATIPADVIERLGGVGPDDPDPANLFRVHWFNAADRRARAAIPQHVVLPKALTVK